MYDHDQEIIYHTLSVLLVTPVLVLNLLLFITIVRTEKVNRDPWRWLIASTAFSMVVFHVLSLPLVVLGRELVDIGSVQKMFWCMNIIGASLVITERFHALRQGKDREGGFDKKTVIILLVFFSIFSLLAAALGTVLEHAWFWLQLILLLWAISTSLVVFVGTLVLQSSKTTNDYVRNAIIRPTLELSCLGFLCLTIPFCLQLIFTYVIRMPLYYIRLAWLLQYAYDIAFPIVWMASWSRNREISLDCGGGEDENQTLLNNI